MHSSVPPMPPTPSHTAHPPLAAIGLTKRYRRSDSPALDAIDLTIARGSVTALVGPNGAGKSTLIRTLLGFEAPSAGRALVEGIDPRSRPADAIRRLGYVSQSVGLYRGVRVDANLEIAASLRPGFDLDGARARLDRLGVPRTRHAGDLSGGQAAQVALAIALATGAPILVLDEPLASLDPLARHEVLGELAGAVRGAGTTVVLSSHIVGDIEAVADALIVLGAGRVLCAGRVAELIASHRIDPDAIPGDDALVARIGRPGGEPAGLVHSVARSLRPPTLDELVLGYLSTVRRPASMETTR